MVALVLAVVALLLAAAELAHLVSSVFLVYALALGLLAVVLHYAHPPVGGH